MGLLPQLYGHVSNAVCSVTFSIVEVVQLLLEQWLVHLEKFPLAQTGLENHFENLHHCDRKLFLINNVQYDHKYVASVVKLSRTESRRQYTT